MIFLRFIYLKGGRRIPVFSVRRRRQAEIWAVVRDEMRRAV